uniref:Aminotransferase-like plant mobile domain-containing protein n=1 Tax=Fagus sylvatica TaxID=28930 RepID=A0A2N9GB68_FAGSY
MARSKISDSPSSSSASATSEKEKARQIITQLNSKSVNPNLLVRYASFPGQNSLGFASNDPFALDRMYIGLKDKWEYLGIADVILASKALIKPDMHLIIALISFWSTTSNTFVFSEGFLSPTLMDVSAMLSLPIEGVNPLSSSLWAHVLQTRDLVVLQNKSSGVEVYSPHFLARQFGLLQSVPIPPIFTANDPWHQRSICTNEEAEVIIAEGLSRITAAKIEPFRIISDALPLFTGWWEALMLSFNLPETLKLTVWEVCPHCLAYEIIEDTVHAKPLQTVLPSPKRSTRVKQRAAKKATKAKKQTIKTEDSTVEKDLASALAKANQVIASQRQEITALSIKAHQDAVSIITKEVPVHLSSPEKKQKLAAEKERVVKIKQGQTLQVEAAMEAKKKAIQDEEEKKKIELERRQKEELHAKRKYQQCKLLRKLRKKQSTPVISTPELELTESTPEDVDQSTALVLAKLTPDAKPLSQQPLLDTPIIKVDIEDLSEPEVDQLIKKASSVLEEMKSASKASTSSTSKTPASPVSQGMNAIVIMRSILEQPLDNLVYDSELRNRFQESTDFLLSQSNLLTEDMLGMLALFSESLDSKLLQISTAISNEKEIQSIQKGYDEQITAKSEFQQEFEQTLKKYEDTKQEISKVRKELQRLENVQDLTQMKLQDLIKQKDNIIDSSSEINLKEKITSLTTEV